MYEGRITLGIDDIRKYMLISLNAVIYLNVFTQINHFPNLMKLNKISNVITFYRSIWHQMEFRLLSNQSE